MTLHHRLCVNPHANISHQTPENDFWGSACRACSSVSILHNQTVSLAAGNTTGYRGKHAAGRVERRFTCRDQVYDGQWEAEDQKHLRKSTGTHLRYVQNRRGFRFSVVEEHQQNMLETKGSLLIEELISIILYIIHSFICALNFVALIQYEKLSAGRLTAGLTVSAARKDDYICKFLWKCIQLKSTWLALFVTQMVHNNCTETFQQGNICPGEKTGEYQTRVTLDEGILRSHGNRWGDVVHRYKNMHSYCIYRHGHTQFVTKVWGFRKCLNRLYPNHDQVNPTWTHRQKIDTKRTML